ncbi:hypothetical protein RND81_13G045600 [Saponaria officinalis]
MAAIRTTTSTLLRRISLPTFRNAVVFDSKHVSQPPLFFTSAFSGSRSISSGNVRCAAAQCGFAGKKASARLSHVQLLLLESDERASFVAKETPPPKIRLEHVSVNFARTRGPGGQHAATVDTKVDMRFNVKKATWLSERIRDKILLLEKNKINKDGEIVLSSTKTRTQQ